MGVGCEAGSPRGPMLKRALGRSLAACFAPPWLVHLPPTSPPPPPKGRGREPRAAAYPLNTPRGPNTLCIRRYREAEENFLGVGCSILGVGCLRIWALGVPHGSWVLGGTDHLLGVGCWALDASGEGVGWCWRTPRGDSEVGAQVPQPALIQAPAGSSGPRKVDGGGTGHPGSGSVWSVCENE